MKRKAVLLTLLGVGLIGLAFLFLRRPPSIPPPVVLHPSVKQIAIAQHHLEALASDASAPVLAAPGVPRQQARQVSPTLRTLHLSEQDLNVYLSGSPSAQKMLTTRHVEAVQIVLSQPSILTIRAAVALNGRAQNIQIDGSLAADPTRGLRYTATHAQVGRLPLPPALVTHQADALAARFFNQIQGRLPLVIQGVQVQGKTLILTGRPVIQHAASPQSVSPAHH